MATFSYHRLSGSTDGLPIKVAQTATAGTLIHTSDASATDKVTLYAMNTDTTDRKLTIEFGGVTAPDHLIEMTIPAEAGLIVVVPGLPLTNSKVVRAFAATANVILISGEVIRIT
jgi:hypothetical protein